MGRPVTLLITIPDIVRDGGGKVGWAPPIEMA